MKPHPTHSWLLFILTTITPTFSGAIWAESLSHNPVDHKTLATSEDATLKAVAALKDTVTPFVHSTKRPFDIYHYVKKEKLQPDPQLPLDRTATKVKNHIREWSLSFWDKQEKGGDLKGLYLAIDPVASRSFGGDNWVMYRVTVPTSSTILEIAPFESQKDNGYAGHIPSALLKVLKAAGCDAEGFKYLLRDNYSPKCREIAHRVYKELGIEALAYRWVATNYPDLPPRDQTAMLYIQPEKLNDSNVAIFSSEDTSNVSVLGEGRYLHNLFKWAHLPDKNDDASLSEYRTHGLWPKLKMDMPYDDLHIWMKDHLMSAGNPVW